MCSPHALRSLMLAALVAVPHTLAAQQAPRPTQRVRPDMLRQLRATMPAGAALTVSGSSGIDTVPVRQPVALRPGQLIVAREARANTVVQVAPLALAPPVAAPSGLPQGMDTATKRGEVPNPAPPPAPAAGPNDSTSVVRLPYTIAAADSTASSGVRLLEARVEIDGGGFSYDPVKHAYVGRILVGIVDHENPGLRIALTDVVIQISGEVDSAEPRTFELARTSLPFREVALSASHPRAETVRIRLIPSFDPAGITIAVPVVVATVAAHASPVHIAGLGLEKTDVLIDPPFAGAVSMTVSALHSHPDPSHLSVGPDGPAVVHVRSQGVGTDTITVRGAGVASTPVEIVYDAPWLFVMAVVAGGVLGGLLNGLSQKHRQDGTALWRLAAVGVLTGLGVAVLYAVGIRIFKWAPDGQYGEAIIFVLSFFGGLTGPRVFTSLLPPSRKQGGGTPSGQPQEPAGVA